MTWRPDLLTLRLFVAVCEERSFSRAAEREATVVSAVSKRISEFEDAVSVQLLSRGGKGVEPTAAGAAVLARARQVLATTELMRQDLQSFSLGERGHVRMLAAVSGGVESFASDLAGFLAEHPLVSVEVEERMAPDIIEGVRAGEADLGLGFASASALDLRQTFYARNNLAVFAAPGHPLHARDSVRFTELLDMDFVALRASSGTTRLLSSLAARESQTLRYRAFTSTLDAAFSIIAGGSAIGVLGEHAGIALQRWHGVKAIRLEEEWAQREVVLYTRDSQAAAPPTHRLHEYLAQKSRGRGAP